MKNLPIEYWQQDYETIPSFYQRYWVQRCLELLDADTSHLFSLESVNSAMLLEELVNTSPNRPDRKKFDGSNARTFHFLLSELQNCISSDIALKNFCDQHFPSSFDFEELKRIVDEGVQKSTSLFNEFGRSLKRENSSEITAKKYVEWLQLFGMAQGASEGLMRQLHEHISINTRESWLKIHHETFFEILQESSIQKDHLERTTQSWLIELLIYHQFGPIHLIELIKKTFLSKSKYDFMERLEMFLEKLSLPARSFMVFMRIQARKEFGRIDRIDRVEFATDGRQGINILNQILIQSEIAAELEADTRKFFYRDAVPRHIFASVGVTAKNVGSAARMAIRELEHAIKQARFEFERSDFSHDNTMFVYDESEKIFHKFTRRQALADQYVARGNPVRFESFVNQLGHIKQMAQDGKLAAIIKQISDLALQWHRNAVETVQPEIRFMNNWIELEQVFKTAKALDLFGGSSSDAVVGAVATTLTEDYPWRYTKDLWGDFERCDVFGPKPYRIQKDGIVRYTKSYWKRIQEGTSTPINHSRRRNKPVDIEIVSQHKDRQRIKGYRIPNGYHVFVKDNAKVKAGQYLAGLDLSYSRTPPMLLSTFNRTVPNLIQAVYIVLHGSQINGRSNLSDSIAPLMLAAIRQLSDEDILDMEWLARLCSRLSNNLNKIVSVGDLKNDYDHLMEQIQSNPRGSKEINIRAQMPYAKEKLQQIPDEKWIPLKFLFEFSKANHPEFIKFELYRNKPPDFKGFRDLLVCDGQSLSMQLPDQPLLQSRIKDANMILNDFKKDDLPGFLPPKNIMLKYVWTLDRMRRTRNRLVHSGEIPANIEVLGRQLYYYSKIYIKSVIYSLGYLDSVNDEDSLYYVLSLTTPKKDDLYE